MQEQKGWRGGGIKKTPARRVSVVNDTLPDMESLQQRVQPASDWMKPIEQVNHLVQTFNLLAAAINLVGKVLQGR